MNQPRECQAAERSVVKVEVGDEPIEDTLTALADVMDANTFHVDVTSHLLRESAETIRSLRVDTINIMSTDGSHVATIDGPLATDTISTAVEQYILKAIGHAMDRDQ